VKRLGTITLAVLLMAALPLAAQAKKPSKPPTVPQPCVIDDGKLYVEKDGPLYAGGQHVCR
jgi:hypothetical protein